MTSLAQTDESNRIADVRFDAERMYVLLQDGREISVPLWWYPRLLDATPEQRNHWEILPFGDALHWPEIDEDLDVHGFLIGAKAPGARRPRASRIDPQIQAHADLWRALQRHNARPMPLRYDETLLPQYEGRVLASADRYAKLIDLAAEFGTPAVANAFLLSAKSVIVKWLELRKNRTITVRHHDVEIVIKGSMDVDKALTIFRELDKKAKNEAKLE
jgi:Protein of unknown function (DUF2442)